MQAQGLFSGVNPDLVAQLEQQNRQKTNLDLAQASNPFASTLFTGLNLADQFKNQVSDVFGNPVEESAAVKAAKEEQSLEKEVAAMVMQGRQQGKDNATIAQEVQQFLLSRGKFQKAEQARMQQMTEEQTGAKSAAEVSAKEAQAAKYNAEAEAALKEKLPSFGSDAEAVTRALFGGNRTYKDLAPTEAKKVLDYLRQQDLEKAKAGSSQVRVDLTDASKKIDAMNAVAKIPAAERAQQKGVAATEALSLLSSNSAFGAAAAKQVIASMFGDSQKAASEIQALSNTGDLPERIANRVLGFLNGQVSDVTKEDMKKVAQLILERQKKIYTNATKAGAEVLQSQGLRIPTFEEAVGIIGEEKKPAPAASTPKPAPQGQPKTMSWNDLPN